ncbi:class I SAM-dependent methyltransferase [Hyphomicrobiales bacterium 4NK60-0047b]
MTNEMTGQASPDYEAIKTKQNAAWGSGDYAKVGVMLQLVGETLAEAMELPYGAPVLDVAAGNGNVTLAMARRGYDVTSSDYVGELLDMGRGRAEAEGFDINFKVADAENLPFDDGSFTGVVSTFGVMFTPNQEQSASELLRVCKSGGRIGLANWTPDGFIGQLFKTLGRLVPPPAGVQSPARWGTQEWLEENFGNEASNISITPKTFKLRFESPKAFIDLFRTYYGPVHKAFLALEPAGQEELTQDMLALIERFNIADDGSSIIAADYLEVLVDKK